MSLLSSIAIRMVAGAGSTTLPAHGEVGVAGLRLGARRICALGEDVLGDLALHLGRVVHVALRPRAREQVVFGAARREAVAGAQAVLRAVVLLVLLAQRLAGDFLALRDELLRGVREDRHGVMAVDRVVREG